MMSTAADPPLTSQVTENPITDGVPSAENLTVYPNQELDSPSPSLASHSTSPPRIHRTMPPQQPTHSPSVRQQRPLSTYTSLGSPIHHRPCGRLRSISLGNAPYPIRSVPNSPNYYGIGNPRASGMSGLLVPHPPFSKGMPSTTTTAPPELSEQRKATEAASAAERARAKALEEEELHMTADELRLVLKKERLRTCKIQTDLASLRSGTARQQLQAEVLEEGRINGLMRRLDVLQAEKGRIIVELEREEEMVREQQHEFIVSLSEPFNRVPLFVDNFDHTHTHVHCCS